MAIERRQHRTPFTYRPQQSGFWSILDTDSNAFAVIEGNEGFVIFLVNAANRYEWLIGAFHLCRGVFDDKTQPYRFPADKAFKVFSDAIQDHIAKFGR